MALWNQKHLPAPPTSSYVAKTQDLDIVKLKNALQDCIKHFKNQDLLIRETALLSRILYRMKMKFRSAKEYKSLEKINHSLNIYINTNIIGDLNNIFHLIPTRYKMKTYLPTRNMLSYILVRMQGLVKLMERVYDTCQVAAHEINTRMAIGHFWRNYVILFALVSRIYVLVKFNTKLVCELYGKLLPHLNKLKNFAGSWLPEGYELPSDLREWLAVDWVYEEEFIDLTKDLVLSSSIKMLDFFNMVDDDEDEVQFCDEYVLIDEEDRNIARDFRKLRPIKETLTRNRMRGFSINEEDIGEDIAEIIKLNETNMENNEGNENDKESPLNRVHTMFNLEDVGEEISPTEYNINDKIQIINLDETNEFLSNIDKTMNPTEINNSSIKSPKIGISKSLRNKTPTKRNTTNTVINLADDTMVLDDTEVIIIPDTPFKKNNHKLQDNSVIVLDDTFSKSSIFSKTMVPEELSKSGKKKRKLKKKKDYLSSISKNLGSTITPQNISMSLDSTNNTLLYIDSLPSSNLLGTNTEEKQDISDKEKQNDNNDGKGINTCEEKSEHQQLHLNINDISSNAQDIIKKPDTKEDTLNNLDNKKKSEESNNLKLERTIEEEIQNNEKNITPSNNSNTKQNEKITENSQGDKIPIRKDNSMSKKQKTMHVEPAKLTKSEKIKRNKEKQIQKESKKKRTVLKGLLEKIGEPQPDAKKKKKKTSKEKIDNNKPNIVCPTLVNESQEVILEKQAFNRSLSEMSKNITGKTNKREESKDSLSNISMERMEHKRKRHKRKFKDSDVGGSKTDNIKKPRIEVSSTSVEMLKNKELKTKSIESKEKEGIFIFNKSPVILEKKKSKKDQGKKKCSVMPVGHMLENKELNKKSGNIKKKKDKKIKVKEFLSNISLGISEQEKSNVWREENLDRSLFEISTEMQQNKGGVKKNKHKKEKYEEFGSNMSIQLLKTKDSRKEISKKKKVIDNRTPKKQKKHKKIEKL